MPLGITCQRVRPPTFKALVNAAAFLAIFAAFPGVCSSYRAGCRVLASSVEPWSATS